MDYFRLAPIDQRDIVGTAVLEMGRAEKIRLKIGDDYLSAADGYSAPSPERLLFGSHFLSTADRDLVQKINPSTFRAIRKMMT